MLPDTCCCDLYYINISTFNWICGQEFLALSIGRIKDGEQHWHDHLFLKSWSMFCHPLDVSKQHCEEQVLDLTQTVLSFTNLAWPRVTKKLEINQKSV